jgi:hypothetical protein
VLAEDNNHPEEAVMWYTVTLDGIPLGSVSLAGAPRAIGELLPTTGYVATGFRNHALRLGIALRVSRSRRVKGPVAARALASAISHVATLQSRLGLVDERARSAAIVHLVVVHFPRDPVPVVVAALREQAAPVAAECQPRIASPGDEARPAA